MPSQSPLTPGNTLFFVCDIQTKFRPAIHGFDHVTATTNKVLQVAKIVGSQVVVTTQKAKALGPVDPAVDLSVLGPLLLGTFDKTLFSMLIPEVKETLQQNSQIKNVVLMGIESHVCVLQTTLDLLAEGITVNIVSDGVSSANHFEVPVALARMRDAGAIITTSESLSFQLVRDASAPFFKEFSLLVKNEKDRTKTAGEALLKSQL